MISKEYTWKKIKPNFDFSPKFFNTVKLGIKELLNKEQIGFKELFTDYQLR